MNSLGQLPFPKLDDSAYMALIGVVSYENGDYGFE